MPPRRLLLEPRVLAGREGESAFRGASRRSTSNQNFELRPLCNVIKVNTDSTGKQATGVTYIDARGSEVEQPASIVVLATYCFNNTRLLLLSGIGKPYDPQSGRGVVGRNYSYQTGGRVHVFFDDREFNPFIGGGR